MNQSARFRAGVAAHLGLWAGGNAAQPEPALPTDAQEVSSSGHRLYRVSAVQRIALLKLLSDLRHVIGTITITALNMAHLRQVAGIHVTTITESPRPLAPARESTH